MTDAELNSAIRDMERRGNEYLMRDPEHVQRDAIIAMLIRIVAEQQRRIERMEKEQGAQWAGINLLMSQEQRP